jgi:deoxyribonucleoside regulator
MVTTALVARWYYIDNRTQVEIAHELGITRWKVARLLRLARRSGLVRINVVEVPPGEADSTAALKVNSGTREKSR